MIVDTRRPHILVIFQKFKILYSKRIGKVKVYFLQNLLWLLFLTEFRLLNFTYNIYNIGITILYTQLRWFFQFLTIGFMPQFLWMESNWINSNFEFLMRNKRFFFYLTTNWYVWCKVPIPWNGIKYFTI